MKAAHQDLQQLKGVGEVLSQRLVEAGLDTFTRIAAAGEDGLKRVKGVNPRSIASILEQAAHLAAAASVDRETQTNELKQGIAGLRDQVEKLAAGARERFQDELAGKTGRKLTKDLVQVVDSLAAIELKLPKRLKRAGKGILKAEQRLTGLAEANVNELRKGLKKSRKALKKVLK